MREADQAERMGISHLAQGFHWPMGLGYRKAALFVMFRWLPDIHADCLRHEE
jgi:hypothetical protein